MGDPSLTTLIDEPNILYFPRGVYLLYMLYLSSMDDVEFALIDSIESN